MDPYSPPRIELVIRSDKVRKNLDLIIACLMIGMLVGIGINLGILIGWILNEEDWFSGQALAWFVFPTTWIMVAVIWILGYLPTFSNE